MTSAVTALVGQRVYPEQLPQKPTLPAITYSQVSAVRVRDLSGPAGKARRRISFSCWATTHDMAHQVADALRQSIDPFYGDMHGASIHSIILENEFDLFEEETGTVGLYRVIQDYIIAHLED
jgi:RNase P/RNase MRP subunit POP5